MRIPKVLVRREGLLRKEYLRRARTGWRPEGSTIRQILQLLSSAFLKSHFIQYFDLRSLIFAGVLMY